MRSELNLSCVYKRRQYVQPRAGITSGSSLNCSSHFKVACEDLKAFERRLTEIIASTSPTTLRWSNIELTFRRRPLYLLGGGCSSQLSQYVWLWEQSTGCRFSLKEFLSCLVATLVLADDIFSQDPATASVSFLTSLYLHPWFSLSGTFISIFLSIPVFT